MTASTPVQSEPEPVPEVDDDEPADWWKEMQGKTGRVKVPEMTGSNLEDEG